MKQYSQARQKKIIHGNSELVKLMQPALPSYLKPGKQNTKAKQLYQVLGRLLLSYAYTIAGDLSPADHTITLPLTLTAVLDLPENGLSPIATEATKTLKLMASSIIDITRHDYHYNVIEDCYTDARFKLGKFEAGVNHGVNHVLRAWQKQELVDYKAMAARLKGNNAFITVELTDSLTFV